MNRIKIQPLTINQDLQRQQNQGRKHLNTNTTSTSKLKNPKEDVIPNQQCNFIKKMTTGIKRNNQKIIKSAREHNFKRQKKQQNNAKNQNNLQRSQKNPITQLMSNQGTEHEIQLIKQQVEFKNNQYFQGWVNKKKQFIQNCNKNKYYSNPQQFNQQLERKQQKEDYIQKVKQSNNKCGTNHFLKQIKLKFAKSLKQQNNKKSTEILKNQINKTEADVIMIHDDQNMEQQDKANFLRYSQRRAYLPLKTFITDANQFVKMRRNNSKNKQLLTEENLNQRINHDSLIPRPESRSKVRLNNYKSGNCLDQKKINNNQKLKTHARHKTLQSYQFEGQNNNNSQNITKNQSKRIPHYIGYQKLRRNYKTLNEQQISKDTIFMAFEEEKNIQTQNQISKTLKVHLKYLKALKQSNQTHISQINPQRIEKAKISCSKAPKSQFFDDKHYNSINKNTLAIKISGIPWQTRMSARCRQQYEKLKNLLKKQQQQQIYSLSYKNQS